MKTTLLTFCGMLPVFLFGQTILTPEDVSSSDLFGRNLAIYADKIIGSTNNFSELNKVYAFVHNNTSWVEDGLLMPDDLTMNDEYGRDLDIYGDYAVVGAPSANGEGRVYVFQRMGPGQWEMMQKLVSNDIASDDEFGLAIDIHGTTILVGAGNKDNGKGACYVFTLNDNTWTQQAKLTSATSPSSRFGHYLSLDGEYAAISAHQSEEVYIFKRTGNSWTEMQKIDSPDGESNSFGVTNMISDDRLVVGSLRDDEVAENAGAAYIYKRNGEQWILEQKLTPWGSGLEGISFGGRVSLSGSYAAIGTLYGSDFYTGSAYIFQRSGDNWIEFDQFTTIGDDYFGWNTDVYLNIVVVAAYGADNQGSNNGAIYVYDVPAIVSTLERYPTQITVEAFPNPAQDVTTLRLPEGAIMKGYEILSFDGKKIDTRTTSNLEIPTASLPGGVYLIVVNTSEGRGLVKVVK